MAESALTRELIAQGLRRPASADPLGDARKLMQGAIDAFDAACAVRDPTERECRLGSVAGHLDAAKHALVAARIRQERQP